MCTHTNSAKLRHIVHMVVGYWLTNQTFDRLTLLFYLSVLYVNFFDQDKKCHVLTVRRCSKDTHTPFAHTSFDIPFLHSSIISRFVTFKFCTRFWFQMNYISKFLIFKYTLVYSVTMSAFCLLWRSFPYIYFLGMGSGVTQCLFLHVASSLPNICDEHRWIFLMP